MNEMRKQQFTEAHTWVRAELDRCVNFWLKNGMDPEFGGVYTCLDRTGKIYSTDKSVWMQGRCGWIFAHLCTVYGTKPEWLDASRSCLDFMERHCFNHAAGDRMYFTVTKDGQPLRQRRYCFSEAFCAMANAEYYAVTGDESRLARARQMADLYWDLNHGMEDPVGMEPKTIPETRSGRAFGIPMIYLNVALILMRCDPERKDVYAARATQCVEEIFKYFVKFDLWKMSLRTAHRALTSPTVVLSIPVTTSRACGSCWSTQSSSANPNSSKRRRPSSTTPSTPVGTRNTADFCTLSTPRVCRLNLMSTI